MPVDFRYNVTAPTSLKELALEANDVGGGFVLLSILGIIWFITLNATLRRGYDSKNCFHAANFVATLASFLMFTAQLVGGEIPLLLMTMTSGTLAYSYMTGR